MAPFLKLLLFVATSSSYKQALLRKCTQCVTVTELNNNHHLLFKFLIIIKRKQKVLF